jgi:hypothetical protein
MLSLASLTATKKQQIYSIKSLINKIKSFERTSVFWQVALSLIQFGCYFSQFITTGLRNRVTHLTTEMDRAAGRMNDRVNSHVCYIGLNNGDLLTRRK